MGPGKGKVSTSRRNDGPSAENFTRENAVDSRQNKGGSSTNKKVAFSSRRTSPQRSKAPKRTAEDLADLAKWERMSKMTPPAQIRKTLKATHTTAAENDSQNSEILGHGSSENNNGRSHYKDAELQRSNQDPGKVPLEREYPVPPQQKSILKQAQSRRPDIPIIRSSENPDEDSAGEGRAPSESTSSSEPIILRRHGRQAKVLTNSRSGVDENLPKVAASTPKLAAADKVGEIIEIDDDDEEEEEEEEDDDDEDGESLWVEEREGDNDRRYTAKEKEKWKARDSITPQVEVTRSRDVSAKKQTTIFSAPLATGRAEASNIEETTTIPMGNIREVAMTNGKNPKNEKASENDEGQKSLQPIVPSKRKQNPAFSSTIHEGIGKKTRMELSGGKPDFDFTQHLIFVQLVYQRSPDHREDNGDWATIESISVRDRRKELGLGVISVPKVLFPYPDPDSITYQTFGMDALQEAIKRIFTTQQFNLNFNYNDVLGPIYKRPWKILMKWGHGNCLDGGPGFVISKSWLRTDEDVYSAFAVAQAQEGKRWDAAVVAIWTLDEDSGDDEERDVKIRDENEGGKKRGVKSLGDKSERSTKRTRGAFASGEESTRQGKGRAGVAGEGSSKSGGQGRINKSSSKTNEKAKPSNGKRAPQMKKKGTKA